MIQKLTPDLIYIIQKIISYQLRADQPHESRSLISTSLAGGPSFNACQIFVFERIIKRERIINVLTVHLIPLSKNKPKDDPAQ